MKNHVDICPICETQGIFNRTNTKNSRVHLRTIGYSGRFITKLCNTCLNKIDSDLMKGIQPKLYGRGFEVIVYCLPIHFYEIRDQLPNIDDYMRNALRFINNIYMGFIKIPAKFKVFYDFAALINLLDARNLINEKEDLIRILHIKYPDHIDEIHEKCAEILNWEKKMNYSISN